MEVLTSVKVRGGRSENLERTGEKIIYFVRHGQSTANLRRETDPYDSSNNVAYADTRLTEKGIQQAVELAKSTEEWKVEIVIASPLSRTLETACNAFNHTSTLEGSSKPAIPFMAYPRVMEFFPQLIENRGRSAQELRESLRFKQYDRFRDIDLSMLEENWWECCGDRSRIDDLALFIRKLPQTRIAIVSHWGFIHELIKSWGFGSVSMPNCSWVRTSWKISIPEVPRHVEEKHWNRHYSLFLMPGGNRNENGLLGEILSMYKEMTTKPILSQSSSLKYGVNFHVPLTKFVPMTQDALDIIASEMKNIRDTLVSRFEDQTSCKHGFDCPSVMAIDPEVECCSLLGVGRCLLSIKFSSKIVEEFLTNLLDDLQGSETFLKEVKKSKESDPSFPSFLEAIDECKTGNFTANLVDVVSDEAHSDALFALLRRRPILHGALDGFPNYAWKYLFRILTWRIAVVSVVYEENQYYNWTYEEVPTLSFPLW